MEQSMKSAKIKPAKLPDTDSIRKLVRFWDTHDLADFEDQLEEVHDPVFKRPTLIKLHLESAEASALKRMARRRRVPASKLVQGWVVERLRAE
jgi:hypothetical protein